MIRPGQATPDGVVTAAGSECDILYLVCHGELIEGAPWIWLVDEKNLAARTSGVAFVTRLMELLHQPQLVVLASCQSAGTGSGEPRTDDNGALAGLGPRLAEAGITAVLAMQGNVTIRTVAEFMPEFFRSLARDPGVDGAVAAARRQQGVRSRDDFWMPALFTRLQSGRIWSPHWLEVSARRDFRPWDSFLTNLDKGEATAIVGFGILEPLLGTREEIAEQWAHRYEYPLTPDRRDDLTQVAQYLAVNENITFPGDELTRQLKRELLCRFDASQREELKGLSLNDLLQVATRLYQNPDGPTGGLDPFAILAGLPFRSYVVTTGDDLLVQALQDGQAREKNYRTARDPQVRAFDGRGVVDGSVAPDDPVEVEKPPPGKPYAKKTGILRPPVMRPLVYYLFGHFDNPESLTLTEDNYVDHLISLTLHRDRLPKPLKIALVDSALLFLGFRFDDWNFRILFRTIMRLQGSEKLRRYTNVAVQVDPERDRISDPQMARRYLQDYFGKTGTNIHVYWGNAMRFLGELRERWEQRQREW